MTRTCLVLIVVLGASTAFAQERPAGAGEPCLAQAQCTPGLFCVDSKCTTEGPSKTESHDARDYNNEGVHAFLGGVLGAALPANIGGAFGEAPQFAIRGGILVNGHTQLQAEISPLTTVLLNVTSQAMPMFEATATIGYLAEISREISWIIRIGGGGGVLMYQDPFSSPQPATLPFGEFRLDVFGVAIRTSRHVAVEFNAPSFRVMWFQNNSAISTFMMNWVTNVTINYVF